MKLLILSLIAIASSNAYSAQTYDCNFGGSHFLLKMFDDQSISLENKFQKFDCEKSSLPYPGTGLELTTLVCAGKFKKVTYYMSQYDEQTIILSPDVIFAKDVTCKKI